MGDQTRQKNQKQLSLRKLLADYHSILILLKISTGAEYWATPLCNNIVKQSETDGPGGIKSIIKAPVKWN